MGRHGGNSGSGLQLYQLVIETSNHSKDLATSWISKEVKGKIDTMKPKVMYRTIVEHFKSYEAAQRFGERRGIVKECRKVDVEPYLNNISYLNLSPKTISIKIEQNEFILNKALEISRPRREFDDKKYDFEIEKEKLDNGK